MCRTSRSHATIRNLARKSRPKALRKGGLTAGSPNRGYANCLQTPEFTAGLIRQVQVGALETVAIRCAAAVPWRCHRTLIGDAPLARFAVVDGQRVTYPLEVAS